MDMRCSVGLITRNIRVTGQDDLKPVWVLNKTTYTFDYNGFNANGYGVDISNGCTTIRKFGWLPGMVGEITICRSPSSSKIIRLSSIGKL